MTKQSAGDASPTIAEVLAEFLAEQEQRLAPRTFRGYREVVELRQHYLSDYAYQTLDLLRPDVHSTYGETNNSGAVINAVRAHAVAGWARAMLSTSFKSYEDALEARDRFTASLDEQMLSASDASYAALLALRGSISEAVPDPASNLPRLRQITLAATIPSLVLASKLYDKTSRWSDVVERNGVRNPMFVPGGVSLTVLTG